MDRYTFLEGPPHQGDFLIHSKEERRTVGCGGWEVEGKCTCDPPHAHFTPHTFPLSQTPKR